LALVISSKISETPYKKKMAVIAGYQEKDGNPVIDVLIVNYGLTTLVINYICIKDEKRECVGSTSMQSPIIIKPSQCKKIYFSIFDINGLIRKNAMDLNKHLTVEVHEYGGRKFKFNKGFPVG
jgi:hypothetical protein